MFDLRLYDSVGSTSDVARQLAQAGAPHGTVVSAREQTAGRGRVGRAWVSPPGNLYLSVLLRLNLPLARHSELSFVAALAVAEMVEAFLPPGAKATLKWPNDVLVGGAKISGILIEQAESATILGIGVNVAHCPAGTPYPATSLEHVQESLGTLSPQPSPASGAERISVQACRTTLLAFLAARLALWLDAGFAPIRADWLARAHPLGTPLCVGRTEGAFAGLDVDGALLLDTDNGRRRIVAGDAVPLTGGTGRVG
jgi:BirA family transcriptional regulator, biotin operon repressor / biotin---[acetyl-CoA-carboxylase] ligase